MPDTETDEHGYTVKRLNQTTVANAEENARLATIAPQGGGWSPSQRERLILTVVVFTLGAISPVIVAGATLPTIIAALLSGAGAGLAAFLGLKSTGSK